MGRQHIGEPLGSFDVWQATGSSAVDDLMIGYGPNKCTLQAPTHTGAFARVRRFVEDHVEVIGVTSGFGGNESVTLQQIAETLSDLDASEPMAGANAYTWTLEIAIGKVLESERTLKGKGRLTLLAYAGRLSASLQLQFDGTPDEAVPLLRAAQTTMGIQLKPSKLPRHQP